MKRSPACERVRNGALEITVRQYSDGRYGFDWLPPGQDRKQIRLHELSNAVRKAREFLEKGHGGKLDVLGIEPGDLEEFFRWKASRGSAKRVPALVEELIATRESKGRSHSRIRELRGVLDAFAKKFPGNIADLNRGDVEAWLDGRGVGPRRWNNMRECIITLHKFARRDGSLPAELTPVEMIEPKRVTVTVRTYSPDEFTALLKVVPNEWRPLLVLGAFAGLRPEEICPDVRSEKPALLWENVLWHKKKIDVPAKVSKVRQRRFAPLLDATVAFLADWKDASGPVVPRSTMYKRTARWGEAAEVKWKPDGLRHSFASYRLAITNDIQALSLEMGNSPRMIHRHYLDLKHEDEAAKWFGLRP